MFDSIKLFTYDNNMETVWILSSTELYSNFCNITFHFILEMNSALRCNSTKNEMNIIWNSYEIDGKKKIRF